MPARESTSLVSHHRCLPCDLSITKNPLPERVSFRQSEQSPREMREPLLVFCYRCRVRLITRLAAFVASGLLRTRLDTGCCALSSTLPQAQDKKHREQIPSPWLAQHPGCAVRQAVHECTQQLLRRRQFHTQAPSSSLSSQHATPPSLPPVLPLAAHLAHSHSSRYHRTAGRSPARR